MADKSLRLLIDTQELNPEDMKEVFNLYGKYGYFLFAENPDNFEETEFDKLPPITLEKGEKSKAQRLRGTLYRVWEQTQNKDKITSEEFYNLEMEKIIEHYKTKLT